VNILQDKKGSIMKYSTFCRGINWDCAACLKKYNEIYLLIKYIKKRSLESSGTPVLYGECMVPKG